MSIQNESQAACPITTPTTPKENLTLVYDPENYPSQFAGKYKIYVGTASSITTTQLTGANITRVLNVAYDVDDVITNDTSIKTNSDPLRNHKEGMIDAAHFPFQFAKVGLIDGFGNDLTTILAAIYMADQLYNFPPSTPIPPLVNLYPDGNLLIHCYSGGSRSVTVTALYLYYRFGLALGINDFSDFQTTYQYVVNTRGPYSYNVNPTEGMCRSAQEIVSQYSKLFPNPT